MALYLKTNTHFLSYFSQFFLKRDIFQSKAVAKIRTHCYVRWSFFEKCNFYEIMWKNIVEPGRPQMTIWNMRNA